MRYIFLLLLIAASVGVFITFVKPRYQEIQKVRQEVAASDENLNTADKLQQSRVALIAKYNSIPKVDLDNLKILLPDSVDNIRLIIQINSLANKNGLSVLKNVDYKSDQDTTSTDQASSPESAKRPYGEFTVSFQTTGQYKNFLTFLSDLEQNLRLVDVVSVDFSSNDSSNSGQQGISSILTYKITLKTYWLKK